MLRSNRNRKNKPTLRQHTCKPMIRKTTAITLFIFVGLCSASIAQDATEPADPAASKDQGELAKATQNPLSDLISLPFQNNTDFGIGPNNRSRNTLNIQPVYPFQISERWNLINRTIVPLIYQPDVSTSGSGTFGLGDIDHTSWLSPTDSGSIVWGVGPAFLLPTATDSVLGTEKFSMGPSLVGLTMKGPWVAGTLAKQFWSVAGDSNRSSVNFMVLQPFINYNLDGGWYLVTAPIMTADWTRSGGDQWLVPLGGGAGKVMKIGKLPVNVNLQAYYNVEKPSSAGDWQLRFQLQFLFPK